MLFTPLDSDNATFSIGENRMLKFQGVQILWGCNYEYPIEKVTESDFAIDFAAQPQELQPN
jgi:hypothetical protein